MLDIGDSGRYGYISELTNSTLLLEFPIAALLIDKISTKIRIIFDISLSLTPIGIAVWGKQITL
jgi:hypothetical protein